MKHSILLLFLLTAVLAGCSDKAGQNSDNTDGVDSNVKVPNNPDDQPAVNERMISVQTVPAIQQLIDSTLVSGSIVIYDEAADTFYTNDILRARTGFLPASTYKITNSIIGLETGAIDTNVFFKWDGKPRRLKQWEADMGLHEAYHKSCLPCYREVARKIGAERMREYVAKLQYGNITFPDSLADLFWVEGESHISQLEQIDFLKRLYHRELPISDNTYGYMRKLMVLNEEAGYKLSGKTGWSIRNGNNVGWFVGYLEKDDKVYFIATNIEPQEKFSMKLFPMVRKKLTMQAFGILGIV